MHKGERVLSIVHLFPNPNRGGVPAGFSLVEVVLAIGIVAFAFVAVVGLLPTGFQTAENGYEQGRATEVLNSAAAAVLGQRYLGTDSGYRSYAFGDWLSDNEDPQSNPIKFQVAQAAWEYADFVVTESGAMRVKSAADPPARYRLYIRVTPPADDTRPVQVYMSVAWPGGATWDATNRKWTKNQGSVETVLYANPPDSI